MSCGALHPQNPPCSSTSLRSHPRAPFSLPPSLSSLSSQAGSWEVPFPCPSLSLLLRREGLGSSQGPEALPTSGGLGGLWCPPGRCGRVWGPWSWEGRTFQRKRRSHSPREGRNRLQALGICSWDGGTAAPAISASRPSGSLFLRGTTLKGQRLGKRRSGIALCLPRQGKTPSDFRDGDLGSGVGILPAWDGEWRGGKSCRGSSGRRGG